MAKFASTLLPQTNDPQEIQKAVLDLLDKINQLGGGGAAGEYPPGTSLEYAGETCPEGFLWEDGASYLRTDYPGLFKAIGTKWGAADALHFNVPNHQGVSGCGIGAQDINGRTKTGPTLGQVREDQMQGHWHEVWQIITAGAVKGGFYNEVKLDIALSNISGANARTIITDGSSGAPRTGAYTYGPEIGMNYIIKI